MPLTEAHLGGFFMPMKKRTYNKPPLTFAEQLHLMEQRGLLVFDKTAAEAQLSRINYYRLSAYFLPYQRQKDHFNAGTTFSQIIDTYKFDRALRLLVLAAIERIEIATRTQLAYQLSHKYNNAHWQDDKKLFRSAYRDIRGYKKDPFNDLQEVFEKMRKHKTREIFLEHYMSTYSEPKNPPSWTGIELLSIGELSNLYAGLRNNADRAVVAEQFGLHYSVFGSWLHAISYVRNLCAHHARLWNRDLSIEPAQLKKPKLPWLSKQYSNNSRVFYFICCLRYLLHTADPDFGLRNQLLKLLHVYTDVPVQFMGIPTDSRGQLLPWHEEPLWQ